MSYARRHSTNVCPGNRVRYKTSAELLFEIFSQRYEQASTLVTSNLPFNEWTEIFGSERLTGALLDRLTHHVHILELNGDSYRLEHSGTARWKTHGVDAAAPENLLEVIGVLTCPQWLVHSL